MSWVEDNFEFSEIAMRETLYRYATQYSPTEAIREYVTNAIDNLDEAIAKGLIDPGEAYVTVLVDPPGRRILVRDNGTGMSHDFLKVLPKRIMDSIKRNEPNSRGELGIGTLAGGSCGNEDDEVQWHLISRQAGERRYASRRYFRKRRLVKTFLEERGFDQSDVEKYCKSLEHGTVAVISGINPYMMKDFALGNLRRELAHIYMPLLIDEHYKRRIKIEVGTYDDGSEPLEFKVRGEKIADDKITFEANQQIKENGKTKKTKVDMLAHLCLWLNLNSSSNAVGLYVKDVRIHDDIRKLDRTEFKDDEIYGCGQVLGFWNVPLTPTLARDNVQKSSVLYRNFVEVAHTKGAEIWLNIVRDKIKDKNLEERTKVLSEAWEVMRDVLQDMKLKPLDAGVRTPRSPIIDPVEPSIDVDDEDIGIDITDDDDSDELKRRKVRFGEPRISEKFIGRELSLRAKIAWELRRPYVAINGLHLHYKEATKNGDSDRQMAYIYDVSSSQMALQELRWGIEKGVPYGDEVRVAEMVTQRAEQIRHEAIKRLHGGKKKVK